MSLLNETQLKQELKSGVFNSPYLIYGDEEYIKSFYVDRIAKAAVSKELSDFNLHKYYGKNLSFEELEVSVEALPIMSEHSCVIVNDMPLDSLAADELKKLENMISDVPDTTVLVFWMDKLEVEPKKSAKWKKIISLFDKYGCAVKLDKRSPAELRKLVCSGAKKRDCDMSPANADYFILSVGGDMTNLLSELEKLCFFVGSGEITKDNIDAVCVKSVEAVVFDLTKAITAKKADRAYQIISQLIYQKTEPVVILGVMSSAYVDMYRAKLFQKSGLRPEDAAKVFDYKGRDFRLRNAAKDASSLSLAALRECMDVLADADELLKSSPADPKTVLEECITKILIISNR